MDLSGSLCVATNGDLAGIGDEWAASFRQTAKVESRNQFPIRSLARLTEHKLNMEQDDIGLNVCSSVKSHHFSGSTEALLANFDGIVH